MTIKIVNDKPIGKIFYGLHFSPGVAQYSDDETDPKRIFINEATAKKMDTTFPGRPIYVRHVDEVDPTKFRLDAAGMVVESFFNSADGFHWAKMAVWGDEGLSRISQGWTLSNAYVPKNTSGAGQWHGVPYEEEITDAEYEHLAIVPDPRYEESKILTTEQFKAYNDEKSADLKRYANSKGDKTMKVKVYKRVVENDKDLDLDTLFIELPKSKKEMSLTAIINGYDAVVNMQGYASDDHMVKVGNEEMTVKKMAKGYADCMNELAEMKKMNEEGGDDEDDSVDNEDVTEPTEGDELGEDEDDKLYNDDDAEESEDDEAAAKKKKNKSKKNSDEDADDLAARRLANARRLVAEAERKKGGHFDKLRNAHHKNNRGVDVEVEPRTFVDGISRGKELFGSN